MRNGKTVFIRRNLLAGLLKGLKVTSLPPLCQRLRNGSVLNSFTQMEALKGEKFLYQCSYMCFYNASLTSKGAANYPPKNYLNMKYPPRGVVS